jgi:hypothetical protein
LASIRGVRVPERLIAAFNAAAANVGLERTAGSHSLAAAFGDVAFAGLNRRDSVETPVTRQE